MPRTIRLISSGVVYHLISRFVNGDWFIASPGDRAQYLQRLGRAFEASDWTCLAYAAMSNHVHILAVAGQMALAEWLRSAHSSFGTWVNKRSKRVGPVFTRGPKDYAVPPELVPSTIAYIHNNPVRAGVVDAARDSSWTSHRDYLGLARAPSWLDVEQGLSMCGVRTKQFDALVRNAALPSNAVDESRVRRAARRRAAVELGTVTVGPASAIPLIGRPWSAMRVDPQDVVGASAAVLAMEPAVLRSRRRRGDIGSARRVAVHAGIRLGLTGADIAAALGISHQAASRIRRTPLRGAEEELACDRVCSELARK